MKRIWAALIIFAVLIAGCTAGVKVTERIAAEMTATVSEAKAANESGDAKRAYELSRKAEQDWRNHHDFLCTYMNHARLEAIDQTLAAMPALCRYGEKDEFAVECDKSIAQFHYLTESEVPSVANIL